MTTMWSRSRPQGQGHNPQGQGRHFVASGRPRPRPNITA